jgi:hypothetical protein
MQPEEQESSGPPPSGPQAFDLSAVPRSVMISAIGAIVLLISVFLDWYTVSVSVSGVPSALLQGLSRSASASGTDATNVANLVALLAVVAIAAWGIELFAQNVKLPFPAWMIAGGAGALSVLLVLFRIVSKPGGANSLNFSFGNAGGLHVDVSTAFGIWLALIAAVAVTVGAALRMREL